MRQNVYIERALDQVIGSLDQMQTGHDARVVYQQTNLNQQFKCQKH